MRLILADVRTKFVVENENDKKIRLMAGNLFKRYVWLIDLIQRTGGIDYEGINRKWQENYRLNETHEPLPKRTLQNHIKAIYEMFGIEIECNRKRDYKYIIINPEK